MESDQANNPEAKTEAVELKSVVREVIGEFLQLEKSKAEPAYKAELADERRKREQLERKLNDLVEENQRSRQRAEEAERGAAIRAELQKLGVTKIDLAFKAVKDEVVRNEQGLLVGRGAAGDADLKDYLQKFVQENPELLPARVSGGSGATLSQRGGGQQQNASGSGIDIDRIKPGMDPEELDRVRREIARITAQPQQHS
jgi:hypothetical protein